MKKSRKHIKKPLYIIYSILFMSIFININNTFADNPTSLDYSVTIKPSLSLTVSSNNIVLNLNPAIKEFGTQDLNITVGTNNSYGYKLYVSSKDNSTELVRDEYASSIDSSSSSSSSSSNGSSDGISATIPTLENSTSDTSSDSFPVNKWGYKLVSNTTNDIVYKPFTSGLLVSESNTPTNGDNSTITFAAKVDYNKPAGTYALDLNFKAIPIVTTYYMQDIAASPTLAESVCTEDPTIVIDKRDEMAYTIRRINGTCWMVDNLQFTGTTMDSTTTNISSEYTPENPYIVNNATDFDGHNDYYDLEGTEGSSSTGHCFGNVDMTTGLGSTYSCIHAGEVNTSSSPIDASTSGQSTGTVWYNYAAASAGTTTGIRNTDATEYDICPKGWKLPNNTQSDALISTLGSSMSGFNPTTGDYYTDGAPAGYPSIGTWWTNTASGNMRRFMYYTPTVSSTDVTYRYRGLYVRCVLGDFGINDIAYMQDFAKVGGSKKTQVINSMELNSTTGYKLKDLRDNNEYTINKIGPEGDTSSQNIWMTSNLLFQGTTLTPDTSNVTTTRYINGSSVKAYYNITNDSTHCAGGGNNSTGIGQGVGYDYACSYYTASDSNIGGGPNIWYNYVAATAGTITGTSNVRDATEDICPKGWRLFKNDEQFLGSTYIGAFKPVAGGYYSGSNPNKQLVTHGYWWASNAYTNNGRTANRYGTMFYSDYIFSNIDDDQYYWRTLGFYVRCIVNK